MPNQARLGDVTDHGGTIITASIDASTNGQGDVRIGDMVDCPIHGVNAIVGGAASHTTNGRGNARIGDVTECGSIIVSGSPDRYVDDSPASPPAEVIPGFQPGVTARVAANAMIEEPGPLPASLRKLQEKGSAPDVEVPDATSDTTPAAPVTAPPVAKDCTGIQTLAAFPPTFQLTPNFNLGSVSLNTVLQRAEVVPQLGLTLQQLVCNLKDAATNILEPLLAQYGRPMITSGFRPAANGKATSNHVYGCAFDLQWSGLTDQQYYERAIWIRDNLQWTELILEFGGNRPWIHAAYRAGNPIRTKMMTRIGAKPDKYATGILRCTNLPGVGAQQL